MKNNQNDDYDEFVDTIDFHAVSRAYRILSMRSKSGGVNREELKLVAGWLTNPVDEIEKDIALRMLFEDSISQCMEPGKKSDTILRRIKKKTASHINRGN